MKTKFLSLLMFVIILFSMAVTAYAEPDLTIDFNKRYTDILEYDEVNDPLLNLEENAQAKEQKRNVYVVVLVACLVVAVVVFIYTLRKVPDEKTFEKEEKKKLSGSVDAQNDNKE